MDYCYACRRHLNGAYSCPGCGTPAERLTPPGAAPGGTGAPDSTVRLPVVTDRDTADRAEDTGAGSGAGGEPGAGGQTYGAAYGDTPPGGGRAARRGAKRARRGR